MSPIKDAQSVTPEGERVTSRIADVTVRPAITHVDDRGEICEIFDQRWGLDSAPVVYVYQALVRPRKVKGWIVHEKQDDRLFVSFGFVKVVLFDARAGSPTLGLLNEIYLSERNRGLVTIPRGVFHAVQNVGTGDAVYVNLPTRPYCHEDPDKYRLPLDTDRIPYRFDDTLGG